MQNLLRDAHEINKLAEKRQVQLFAKIVSAFHVFGRSRFEIKNAFAHMYAKANEFAETVNDD